MESRRYENTLNPVFNEIIYLFSDGANNTLTITVLDDDLNKTDDSLGYVKVDLSNFDFSNGAALLLDQIPLENAPEGNIENVGTASISVEIAHFAIPGIEKKRQGLKDSTYMDELNRLFPPSDITPRFNAVIGGQLTAEKLRVMDQLIDAAETIVIIGEAMLPFLSIGVDITSPID